MRRILAVVALMLLSACPTLAQTVTVGAQTTVMTFAQRNAIAQFWPDGGVNAVLHNSTNYVYSPGGGSAGMFGETISDLSNWNSSISHVSTTTNIPLGASTAFDSTFAGGGALYFDAPSGILIGLYHGEHNFGGGIFYSGHGLAYSTDFGVNWHKLGPVVLPQASFASSCGVEVGNGTLVSDGTFLYDYYSDMPQSGCPSSFASSITVARASIASVRAAAQAGTPFTSGPGSLFMKFTGSGTWNGLGVTDWGNQSGGGGAFTAFFGSNDNFREPVVRFNGFLNQYVLTYVISDQSAIIMRFSSDGLTWGTPTTIITNAGGTVYYPSMLNIAGGGADPQAIGQNFALFFIQPFGGVWTSTTIQRLAITVAPSGGGSSSNSSVYTSLSSLPAGVTPSLAAMQSNAVQCTPGNGTWNGGSRANIVVTSVPALSQFGSFNLECGTAVNGAGAQMLDYTTASPTPTGPNANFGFGAVAGRTAISMGWDYCMNFDQAVQGGQYSGSGINIGTQTNLAIGGVVGNLLALEVPGGGANNSQAPAYHGGNCPTDPTAHRWITLQMTATTASMNVYNQAGTTLLGHSTGAITATPSNGGFFEMGISGAEAETPGFHIYNGNMLFDLVNGTFPLLPPASSVPPLWNGMIANARASNSWATAGVIGGIPSATWPQSGATIAAGASSATIQAALNACAGTNKFVLLGPGTFSPATAMNYPAGCELRGSGPNSTFMVPTSGIHFTTFNATGGTYTGAGAFVQWTSGYAQGSKQIIVSSVAGVTPNVTEVILDQCEDNYSGDACATGGSVDNGNYKNCTTNGATTNACSATGEGADGQYIALRYQAELFLVTAINQNSCGATCLTLDHGLDNPNWTSARTPHATYFTPAQFAGLSNFSIDSTAVGPDTNGSPTISMGLCLNCWVHNMRIVHNPSAGISLGHFTTHYTIDNSYIAQSNVPLGNSKHAIVELDAGNGLIQNNILQSFSPAISTEGFAEGDVVAYNLCIGDNLGSDIVSTCYHAHSGGDTHTLYEGNIGYNSIADNTHGSQPAKTWYRNFSTATSSCANGQCGASVKDFDANGLVLEDSARGHNILGNIFGTPTVTNQYAPSPGAANTVYLFSQASDPLVKSTALVYFNWDNVTGATRFCGGPSNTGWTTTCASTSEVPVGAPAPLANPIPSLGDTTAGQGAAPPSLYSPVKPAFFGSNPWPPIGPDVTGGNVGQCNPPINVAGKYNALPALNAGQCAGSGINMNAWAGHVNATPALKCYLGPMGGVPDGVGTGGSANQPALAFDPVACGFTSGGGGSPNVSIVCTQSGNASINFGTQPITVPTGQQPCTLTNTGTAVLTISSVVVTGANAAQYALVTPSAGTDCRTIGSVNAGATCVFAVVFTPNTVQTFSAAVTLTDNASPTTQTVPLTGIGSQSNAPAPSFAGQLVNGKIGR